MKINWEYCECGCKCYTVSAAGITFNLYWDLKDGWYLSEGSRYNEVKYKSQAEANRIVRARFKKVYKELKTLIEG